MINFIKSRKNYTDIVFIGNDNRLDSLIDEVITYNFEDKLISFENSKDSKKMDQSLLTKLNQDEYQIYYDSFVKVLKFLRVNDTFINFYENFNYYLICKYPNYFPIIEKDKPHLWVDE